MLLSSHILGEVEAMCDRVSIIRDGVVVVSGTIAEPRHLSRTTVTADLATVPQGLAELAGLHDLVVAGQRVISVKARGMAELIAALGGVAWLLLVAGLATGLGHAVAIGDPGQVLRATVAAPRTHPGGLVHLVFAVWGLYPRATAVGWGAYTACFVVGDLGPLLGLPRRAMDTSPFAHSPVLPGPSAELSGLVWLTMIVVGFLAGGSAAFRRRDLAG